MMKATNKKHEVALKVRGGISKGNWPYRFARVFYFVNALIMICGLAVITLNQSNGLFRCKSLTVTFDEEIWETANIVVDVDSNSTETKDELLIYSWFTGTYIENGVSYLTMFYLKYISYIAKLTHMYDSSSRTQKHDGYPKYSEQNKIDNKGFVDTVGAELLYCGDLGAWVFRHPDIKTSRNGEEENECNWLMRSPETSTYDIEFAASFNWYVWLGEIKPSNGLTVSCNECIYQSDQSRSGCSYRGTCSANLECQCEEGAFGYRCEFEVPCTSLVTEKRGCCGWQPEQPILLSNSTRVFGDIDMAYNRPVYMQRNLTGIPYDLRKFDILWDTNPLFDKDKGKESRTKILF